MPTPPEYIQIRHYSYPPKAECDHKGKRDLTQGLGDERHSYCPKCKAHIWRGLVWTAKELEAYVNGDSGC